LTTEATSPFIHRVRPQFYQADPAGVLFYGRVFELFHQGYAALIEAAGVPYETHFGIRGYATPIVHAEADYKRPIRPGTDIDVAVSVERLGESSLTFAFRITDATGTVLATGREVHVTVDPASFTTRPLPDELRAALTPWLA
jgi:YbgC/YbaW family acyl-CoA thioester hydrolase